MGAHKTQRTVAQVLLVGLTVLWLAFWLVSWFVLEEPGMTEQGFYLFWIFVAATLVFWGLRATIYE